MAPEGGPGELLRDFCRRLDRLRNEVGGPSVDSLARDPDVPMGRTQIYAILAGRISTPPSWDFVQAFLRRCQAQAARRGHRPSIPTDLEQWRTEHALLVEMWTGLERTPPPEVARGAPVPLTVQETYLYPLPGGDRWIGVITGDIRQVRSADIWVNSENAEMVMARIHEFSVSAIIRYEGARRDAGGRVLDDWIADELERKVAGRRPLAPGAAIVTGPGQLRERNGVRHVIHTAAVHGEPGSGFQPIREIGRCVENALIAAEELDSGSTVLFPLLGTGVGGADVTASASHLIHAAINYLRSARITRIATILFLAYTDVELDACQAAIAAAGLRRS